MPVLIHESNQSRKLPVLLGNYCGTLETNAFILIPGTDSHSPAQIIIKLFLQICLHWHGPCRRVAFVLLNLVSLQIIIIAVLLSISHAMLLQNLIVIFTRGIPNTKFHFLQKIPYLVTQFENFPEQCNFYLIGRIFNFDFQESWIVPNRK